MADCTPAHDLPQAVSSETDATRTLIAQLAERGNAPA